MANANDRGPETSTETRQDAGEAVPAEAREGSAGALANRAAHPDQHAARATDAPAGTPAGSSSATPRSQRWRTGLLLATAVIGLVVGGYLLFPQVETMLNTVSTDDAYVNGHVTFLAPRVPGQVSRVLVDDNYRVKKGAILVQLDKEPYQIQLAIKQAAVVAAEADLKAANAQTRGLVAEARANRYQLEHAIEDVHTQVANLQANVATLNSRKATLELARANLRRGEELIARGGISKEDLDTRRQTVKVDEASVDQALQAVHATRVGLGLPAQPPEGHELTEVPADLDQNFSVVRRALGQLLQTGAQLGYTPASWDSTPKQAIEEFYKQDPKGDLQHIFAKLIPEAPAVKQAEAKLLEAQRDLDQAKLNLRYCDVVSEIDGVVTRRNVNPGNNVTAGQSLMAIRSLSEIWIDANFKETQLANLRIGQHVRCEVDMYGSRREYDGRITGFTMGTGQTLSLLPPQNATGNFVKIVQRLPVRIELTDYDPNKSPLFVGLSVVPYVYYKEPPTGPHAGDVLQPLYSLPEGQTVAGDQETPQPKGTLPGGQNTP